MVAKFVLYTVVLRLRRVTAVGSGRVGGGDLGAHERRRVAATVVAQSVVSLPVYFACIYILSEEMSQR